MVASSLVALWAWGCGSSEEQRRVSDLAGSCAINSDCKNPLVCAFAHCHIACTDDRDCDAGLRCVKGEIEGSYVCQLPEEVECENDRDCPGETQVCGIDDECRDPCDMDRDCTPTTQICANSGECASTVSTHDHVDADGNIVVDGSAGKPSAAGGAAGDSSSGGTPGGGESSGGTIAGSGGTGTAGEGESGEGDAGGGAGEGGGGDGGSVSSAGMAGGAGAGAGGSAGAGGTGGSAGAGAGGTSGSAGTGGSAGAGTGGSAGAGAGGTGGSAGAGAGEILRETSDGVETVPNDTRETAVAVSQPSTATIFVAGGSDEDWFSVTPPLDGKTHVISVEIAQDAGVGQQLRAYTLANHAQMGFYDFAGGSTGYVHATAGPGATILFRFFRSSGNISTGLAHLSFDFEVENDAHEPNDTKQAAAPIELDTTYSAMMTDPWVSDLDRPVQDWFAVDLEAGTATVALSAVPSQGRIEVYRVNPAGGSTQLGANNTGETRTFPAFSVPEAGTYYVMFQPYSGTSGFVKGVKPTYLTEPYTFRVTQP